VDFLDGGQSSSARSLRALEGTHLREIYGQTGSALLDSAYFAANCSLLGLAVLEEEMTSPQDGATFLLCRCGRTLKSHLLRDTHFLCRNAKY